MGTIKCGFWTKRFLLSPEEFSDWVDLCEEEGFFFENRNGRVDVKIQYEVFYQKRMDREQFHLRIPGVAASLSRDGFQSGYHVASGQWRFYFNDRTSPLADIFIQFSTPKAYAVKCDDDIHFTYEDILRQEPLAKSYFDQFTQPIQAITKPLYQFGKPMYAVRISKQAYADLLESAFYQNMQEGMTSKWKL